MGRTLTMMDWLRAGGCLRVCWIVWMGLLLAVVGNRAAMAQGVTTTNEVRAMRGLGPLPEVVEMRTESRATSS
jgi:hypothetical protein